MDVSFGASLGWRDCRFVDVCERVSKSAQPLAEGERPYIGLEHLVSGFPALNGIGMESTVKSGKTAFQANDVLFGKLRPYLRKSALVDFDGICSTDILVFRAKSHCDPEFLCYLLHTEEFIDYAKATQSGVQHPRTSWPSLKEYPVSLPPLDEQQRIAAVLSLVQRTIEQQERLIGLTTELKKALMHKLFTEGMRGEPQKETEIGPVPESWDIQPLGSIAQLKSGATPSRKRADYWLNGTIPWVKTGEVQYCEIYDAEEKITPLGLANSSVTLFPSGTLLMAMYGQGVTRGKVALLGIEAATNQACVAIIPKCPMNSKYLYYYFEHKYEYLRSIGHGANQTNLSAEILKSVPVACPQVGDEQDSIVETLDVVDRNIVKHQKRQRLLSELFSTLLHQLMTAQIRVNDLDLSKLISS